MGKYVDLSIMEFHDFAVEHGEATRAGDDLRANKLHGQLMETTTRLKSNWPANESELLQLLSEKDDSIRLWGAATLLNLSEDVAIRTLEELRAKRGIASLSARAILDLHQKGDI